jgi:hypothetical protein
MNRACRSTSARLSARADRLRRAGRIPLVGDSTEKTEKIDDECRSNSRPIELIDPPRRNLSQISARCSAE